MYFEVSFVPSTWVGGSNTNIVEWISENFDPTHTNADEQKCFPNKPNGCNSLYWI